MEKKEITLYEAVISKGLSVLSRNDFVEISGRIEITRDGALKLLSSLPLSYEMEILEQELTQEYARVVVKLTVEFQKADIRRTGIGTGICEKRELERNFSLHNLVAKAETRGLKRAIEVCLGGVINAIIQTLFMSENKKTDGYNKGGRTWK